MKTTTGAGVIGCEGMSLEKVSYSPNVPLLCAKHVIVNVGFRSVNKNKKHFSAVAEMKYFGWLPESIHAL